MILLLTPAHEVGIYLPRIMKREGYTNYQELEPKAGCRRFRLS